MGSAKWEELFTAVVKVTLHEARIEEAEIANMSAPQVLDGGVCMRSHLCAKKVAQQVLPDHWLLAEPQTQNLHRDRELRVGVPSGIPLHVAVTVGEATTAEPTTLHHSDRVPPRRR